MNDNPPRSNVVVLGAPGSGTWLLAQTLDAMGAWLADSGEAVENEAWPHWKTNSPSMPEINNLALTKAGARRDTPLEFSLSKLPPEAQKELGGLIEQWLRHTESRQPWAAEDPALCLTFPLWRRHLTGAVAVLAYREPVRAARILQQRYGYSMQLGLAMWES